MCDGRPLPINTPLVLNILKEIPRTNMYQIAEAVNLSEIIVKTVLDTLTSTVKKLNDIHGCRYSTAVH